MLKTTYDKLPPIRVNYRKYKHFNRSNFLSDLSYLLCNSSISDYSDFHHAFTTTLDRHAPMKTRFLRPNNSPHITKELRQAIMKRSRLKNIANKTKNPEHVAAYKRQRNLVVNLNRQAKRSFLGQAKQKDFWKICKPNFSDKTGLNKERIILVENGEILNDDSVTAEVFNNYFNRITDGLDLPPHPIKPPASTDPVSSAILDFSLHPSISRIGYMCKDDEEGFEFSPVTEDMVKIEILELNKAKKVSGSIPIKVLKLAANICAPVLAKCFNDALVTARFPDELKRADIVPIHKKGSTTDKANFRPISILPTISKIYERLVAKQLNMFMEKKLSKYLCGFRKGYNTQYALLNMLRNWQNCLSNKGKVGAILMDLSKAFDCLPHDLLIAKLKAYGFGQHSLRFLHSYLSNRKHRVRISSSFSEWLEPALGVPQGSVLGPILFNIFINDLLFSVDESEICNFADDNTLYICDSSIDNVLRRLNADVSTILEWFKCNYLVVNPAKFQLIFPGTEKSSLSITVGSYTVSSTDVVKLLGINIDSQLTFYPHVKEVCKKASQKIKALLRIRNYLSQSQTDLLLNSYILSAFNYCPLVWMFCSKQAHNLINATHRRALCAKMNQFSLSLHDLLGETESASIHTKHLRLLLIEVYMAINKLSPEIMWDTFDQYSPIYDLRRICTLKSTRVHTVLGSNSFDFRASLAWNKLPVKFKSLSIEDFKPAIEQVSIYCHCKNCYSQ